MSAEQLTEDKAKLTEAQILGTWRSNLDGENNRGARAELKRAGSVNAVLCQAMFFRLLKQLDTVEGVRYHPEAIAVIAGITPFLKRQNKEEDSSEQYAALPPLPEKLGKSIDGDRPVFSQLRFQRLLAARDAEELMSQLRRALVQVGGEADYLHLTSTVLRCYRQWNNPDNYQGVKQWQFAWSSSYYQEVSKYKKDLKS